MSDRDADLLAAFIDWNIYNGAPGAGQALYNSGGNPWLHARVEAFLADYAAEQYFRTAERLFGDDKQLMKAVQSARISHSSRRVTERMNVRPDGSSDE